MTSKMKMAGADTTPPPISETAATIYAILLALSFVAPFYLSRTLRTSPLNHRNSPVNIRARVRAVGLTCALTAALTALLLSVAAHASGPEILHLTGLFPVQALDLVRGLLLVAILFVGPLYEALYVDAGWRNLSFAAFRWHWWDSWTGFRNYTVAPAGEEFVFRALVVAVYLCTGASGARIVFVSPLVFGVAHVHHLVEFLQHHTPKGRRWPGGKVVVTGVLRSTFQFAYTSLFGFFAAFVFLRTGSLFAAIVVHSFCNFMGFPRVSGKVGQFEAEMRQIVPNAAPDGSSADNATPDGYGSKDLGIGWTLVYYILLVGGAVGFYRCLWPLTESSNALIIF